MIAVSLPSDLARCVLCSLCRMAGPMYDSHSMVLDSIYGVSKMGA